MPARTKSLSLGVCIILALASPVSALINPDFTPVDLVRQAVLVETITLGTPDKGKIPCKVKAVLKGKASGDFNLLLPADRQAVAAFVRAQATAAGKRPAVFLVGKFPATKAAGRTAFLHVNGKWLVLVATGEGTWRVLRLSTKMEGTWSGSTAMLIRAVKYTLQDDDPDFPVESGADWDDPQRVGQVAGEVHSCTPVDLAGDGRPLMFVASSKGDHLFAYGKGGFRDLTAEKHLVARSAQHVWLDLNHDGRLDLVSAVDRTCTLHLQKAAGVFGSTPLKLVPDPVAKGTAQGLFMVNGGQGPALLVLTPAAPLLYRYGPQPLRGAPLAGDAAQTPGPGASGACLVADLDGDGWADVLHLFARGSLLYRGTGNGRFAAARACCIAPGEVPVRTCVGDYDADGRLDVFTTTAERNRLWHNRGGGRFEEYLAQAGEVEHVARPGAVSVGTCEINNDGRQDFFLAYADAAPHVFFNRGFFSFGHAHSVDLVEQDLLPRARQGLQAGCVADFDGDGAQDMALVTTNGEIWFLPQDADAEDALAVKVFAPPAGPVKAPITVSGWVESGEAGKLRCLGAWNLVPGGAAAFIGVPEPGPCTIRWRLPGGKPAEKRVEVEAGAVKLAIKQ